MGLRRATLLVSITVGVAALSVFGLPEVAIRYAISLATPWLTSEGPAARIVGTWVEGALAARLAERAAGAAADHVALERIVSAVRDQILNPSQVLHLPQDRRALLMGFGYCDQINAAIARAAASRFSSAQLFALYDAEQEISPHTVGRVWSSEREDWLYFDGFFERPVIYTRRPDGTVEYLPVTATPVAARGKPREEFYQLGGWIMNEYRASLPGYLGLRLMNRLGFGNIEAPPPQHVPGPPLLLPPSPLDQAVFERIARRYLTARVNDLLGEDAIAGAYQGIATDADAARDWRAAQMAAAARLFAAER